MGKTGTTTWVQVKGVKGQIRLVPGKEGTYKKPGPNQRYKSGAKLKRAQQSAADRGRGRGRRPRGRGAPEVDRRVRRRIKRSIKTVMGSKGRR
jgi:hypothetical protein